MGRGGGGSSGGRSFSSSSGRSFGGRSGSGSRGGSSPSRGGSSFRTSSSYRPSTVRVNNYHYGGMGYGGFYGGRPSGIASMIVAFLILAVALPMVIGMFAGSGGNVSRSTLERTAIQPAGPFDRDCVDDRADWTRDRNVLLSGMEQFYKDTGIQPALCITENFDGQDPEAYATARYDELVGHEKGLLLLFYEPAPSDWDAYYMAGESAQTVMDSEACDILMDYVEAYYTSDMTEDEYFAAVFRETGERIMTVTPTVASRIPVIVAGIVAVAGLAAAVLIVKAKHKRDRERAEETERLLHTHIDRI